MYAFMSTALAAQPASYAADAYPTTSALNGMIQPGTPDGVPPEFDCAMRAFAYEVGKAKLPERAVLQHDDAGENGRVGAARRGAAG